MVKVRDAVPELPDGAVDVEGWAAQLHRQHSHLQCLELVKAGELLRSASGNDALFNRGIELANLVASLRMDTASVAAALFIGAVRQAGLEAGVVTRELRSPVGADAASLVETIARMSSTPLLEMTDARLQTTEARNQVDNVRRMLVSLIDDARVAVLKLAELVVDLRSLKEADPSLRAHSAEVALRIFAPLANRMGIWRLKWELEDLSLRYLEPDAYKVLAKQLDGRRVEREHQVAEIARQIEETLRGKNIDATVMGRAKHLFSIWRKMRHKNVGLEEVYDVRAVRVLVPDIAQCYAALGIIHTRWQHIPNEFDDYIAVPKENGYRSIHTAVMAPDGKALEVQIRTVEMHQESELGVCAHWAYKGDSTEAQPYDEKMNWLRQLLEWQESFNSGDVLQYPDALQAEVEDSRIFVTTPDGHVIDLTNNATPLDFAYRVHTEVGHRCESALVDGMPVALNTPLKTGQSVEIVTGANASPRREWLERRLGYIHTSRAKEKVQDWFRERSDVENLELARQTLTGWLHRLGLSYPSHNKLRALAQMNSYEDDRALLIGLAVGDYQLIDLVEELYPPPGAQIVQPSLLPDMPPRIQETLSILVVADDREGLLRDVVMVLSEEQIGLVSNSAGVAGGSSLARIHLELKISGFAKLAKVIERLRTLANVHDVHRVAS